MEIYKRFYIKSLIFSSLLFIIGGTSCNKTLDVKPTDQVAAEVALTSTEGIKATLSGVYATLKTEAFYGNRLVLLGDALADNAQATNKSGRFVAEAANNAGSSYSQWSAAYNALNRINLVLEALPNVSDASQEQKDRWTGELKFLRALFHFDLVKAYAYIPGAVVDAQNRGGIPIASKAISSSSDALTADATRAPIDEVYTFIYSDLDDAIAKLDDMPASPAKANKQAAQLLYSRVALYRRDWPKVIRMASEVIVAKGAALSNASNYVKAFTGAVNPESLFEVTSRTTSETLGVSLSLQSMTTTLVTRSASPNSDAPSSAKAYAGFGDVVPTVNLLNALGMTIVGNGSASTPKIITSRSQDVRNLMFEVGANKGSGPYVECTKYFGRGGAVNVDNVPVLRIAEAYLNRAEAYANTPGEEGAALSDVNTIRTNRGLTAVSGLTGEPLADEIALQRRLEFAFEGQRFFDLKRKGLDIFKPASSTTVLFTDRVILPAIPAADVTGSKGKIPQNFGYN